MEQPGGVENPLHSLFTKPSRLQLKHLNQASGLNVHYSNISHCLTSPRVDAENEIIKHQT